MIEIISRLSETPLFTSLGAADLRRAAEAGFKRVYARNSTIVQAGEVWPYLLLVLSGKINAIKESHEGRSLLVASIQAGEIFWGLAFFHDEAAMPVMLQVVEQATIFLWPRERLLPILIENGKVSWELCRLMMKRMLLASEILEKLAFQPVAGRLARLLLEQTQSTDVVQMPRDLTLDEMAAHIGSTREVVSRFLHRFSDDGLISLTRTEYSINDRMRLEDLAQKVKG